MTIIYIPSAYLHNYVDKHGEHRIIKLFKRKLEDLILMVDTKLYRKYGTYDKKGNAMLYVETNKALYGPLKSALFFYKKLSKDLKAYGFVINTYDPCVVNAMI